MSVSLICPFCGERSTKHVCARCALTTAEERDAARAEVARLTDVVDRLTVVVEAACAYIEGDKVVIGHAAMAHVMRLRLILRESVDSYRASTATGATDAAT